MRRPGIEEGLVAGGPSRNKAPELGCETGRAGGFRAAAPSEAASLGDVLPASSRPGCLAVRAGRRWCGTVCGERPGSEAADGCQRAGS